MIRVTHTTVSAVCIFTKKKKKERRQKTEQTHNLLLSILVFVRNYTYLVLRVYVESRNPQYHTCC